MYDKTDVDLEDLLELDGLETLAELDPNELIAQMLVAVLGKCNEELAEHMFYVENDLLLGLYVKAAVRLSGRKVIG